MNQNITFLERLKKIIPQHIKPKFDNDKELLQWNKQQGKLYSQYINEQNQAMKIQYIIEKSGIRELYINCSFTNYIVTHQGQKIALEFSKKYAQNFDKSVSSFIFSGTPGTGKNHLAAAIGNYLIFKGKHVLIITVADLMSDIKDTFNKNKNNTTEKTLLHTLSTIDLLIIDEVGIQIESRYEKIIINQIIDRRSASKKSTGILSNLNYIQMKNLLGERIMDRMCLGDNLWLNFHWESYRKNSNIKNYKNY